VYINFRGNIQREYIHTPSLRTNIRSLSSWWYLKVKSSLSLTLLSAETIRPVVPHRIMWSWYTGRWWVVCFLLFHGLEVTILHLTSSPHDVLRAANRSADVLTELRSDMADVNFEICISWRYDGGMLLLVLENGDAQGAVWRAAWRWRNWRRDGCGADVKLTCRLTDGQTDDQWFGGTGRHLLSTHPSPYQRPTNDYPFWREKQR